MKVAEMLDTSVPLMNQRHEVVRARLSSLFNYAVPMVQEYVPGYEEALYFRQEGPHTMVAGVHSNDVLDSLATEDPDQYARVVEWDTVERVAVGLSARLLVDNLGFAEGWTGLYPASRDGKYIVGPHKRDESIVTVGGLGGSGLASGLAVGRVAAEWAVLGDPVSLACARELVPDRDTLSEAGSGQRLPNEARA
jgi:sarcosine oxidase subunit beta